MQDILWDIVAVEQSLILLSSLRWPSLDILQLPCLMVPRRKMSWCLRVSVLGLYSALVLVHPVTTQWDGLVAFIPGPWPVSNIREGERERARARESSLETRHHLEPLRVGISGSFWNHKRGRGVWEDYVHPLPFGFQERRDGINPERRLTFPGLFILLPHNQISLGPLRPVSSGDPSTWM